MKGRPDWQCATCRRYGCEAGCGCVDCHPTWANTDAERLVALIRNLSIAGALCVAFRAGDNHGFHMGSDETQCTCQWAPNTHGEAYRGATRCEQEEAYDSESFSRADLDYDESECPWCDYGCAACNPLVGGEG